MSEPSKPGDAAPASGAPFPNAMTALSERLDAQNKRLLQQVVERAAPALEAYQKALFAGLTEGIGIGIKENQAREIETFAAYAKTEMAERIETAVARAKDAFEQKIAGFSAKVASVENALAGVKKENATQIEKAIDGATAVLEQQLSAHRAKLAAVETSLRDATEEHAGNLEAHAGQVKKLVTDGDASVAAKLETLRKDIQKDLEALRAQIKSLAEPQDRLLKEAAAKSESAITELRAGIVRLTAENKKLADDWTSARSTLDALQNTSDQRQTALANDDKSRGESVERALNVLLNQARKTQVAEFPLLQQYTQRLKGEIDLWASCAAFFKTHGDGDFNTAAASCDGAVARLVQRQSGTLDQWQQLEARAAEAQSGKGGVQKWLEIIDAAEKNRTQFAALEKTLSRPEMESQGTAIDALITIWRWKKRGGDDLVEADKLEAGIARTTGLTSYTPAEKEFNADKHIAGANFTTRVAEQSMKIKDVISPGIRSGAVIVRKPIVDFYVQ